MSSRLLDREALTADSNATKRGLERFSAGGQATVYIVSGKGVRDARPRGGGTAVHPSWRRTYVHASKWCCSGNDGWMELTTSAATVNFASLNAAAKEAAIAQTRAFAAGLRELAPEMGAYVNEVSGGSSGCCLLFAS